MHIASRVKGAIYFLWQLTAETRKFFLKFSKKVPKIDEIFTVNLRITVKKSEDFVNFCGLLRKRELYRKVFKLFDWPFTIVAAVPKNI